MEKMNELNCRQVSALLQKAKESKKRMDQFLSENKIDEASSEADLVQGFLKEINEGLFVETERGKMRIGEYNAMKDYYATFVDQFDEEAKKIGIASFEFVLEDCVKQVDKFGHVIEFNPDIHTKNESLPFIAKMPFVEIMRFNGGRDITDIDSLASLKKLKIFELSSSSISDISVAQNWPEIEDLALNKTEIVDLDPLRESKNLKKLYLTGSPVASLVPLENLSLRVLGIGNLSRGKYRSTIDDLSPLKNMTEMSYLSIVDLPIEDFSAIENMTEIAELSIDGCKINDLNFLNKQTKMLQLFLNNCQIKNVEFMRDKAIGFLDLSENPIDNILPLGYSDVLTLNLSETKVTDLSPCLSMRSLQALTIGGTPAAKDFDQQRYIRELQNKGVRVYL